MFGPTTSADKPGGEHGEGDVNGAAGIKALLATRSARVEKMDAKALADLYVYPVTLTNASFEDDPIEELENAAEMVAYWNNNFSLIDEYKSVDAIIGDIRLTGDGAIVTTVDTETALLESVRGESATEHERTLHMHYVLERDNGAWKIRTEEIKSVAQWEPI